MEYYKIKSKDRLAEYRSLPADVQRHDKIS